MLIMVNGEERECPESATITELLHQLNVPLKYVAVELNKELIPRQHHATITLQPGDILEVVTLTGGG